jgi:hypothetical protein
MLCSHDRDVTGANASALERAELASLRQLWRPDYERSAVGYELDRSGI